MIFKNITTNEYRPKYSNSEVAGWTDILKDSQIHNLLAEMCPDIFKKKVKIKKILLEVNSNITSAVRHKYP